MNKNCQVCGDYAVTILLDFGHQPLCNRFSISPHKEDYYHPLILGQCQSCSLIQLMDPISALEIIPKVEWLKYKEPDGHLDNLADILVALENLPTKPTACGITYKDDSLLERLEKRLFDKIWRIDPEYDLGITNKGVAGETIIPKLTNDSVNKITKRYGQVDVIIARHILEHALDTQDFLSVIWNMLKPNGYIVFEVPDSTKQLKNKDYTMPWEEHILYFIPETLKAIFRYTSYELVQYCHYPYKIEDVQVAVVRKSNFQLKDNLQPALENFILPQEYAISFETHKNVIYSYLKEYVSSGRKVVFYGAGHLSVILVKSLGIEKFIECVIDDSQFKQNLFLPGTSLQIKSSELLLSREISLCIFCLSIEYENIIMKKNNEFIEEGGVFTSAFPAQKNSLFNLASNNLQI